MIAGYGQSYPTFPRQYVLLHQVPAAVHHVVTERTTNGKHYRLELLNVLLPTSQIQQLQGDHFGATYQLKDQILITLGVLPDLQTGEIAWVPINPDTLGKQRELASTALFQNACDRIAAYKKRPGFYGCKLRRDDVVPIVFRNGRYWTCRNTVLTEYFLVRTQPLTTPFQNDGLTINTAAPLFTAVELSQLMQNERQLKSPRDAAEYFFQNYDKKLFLGKRSQQTYEFWEPAYMIADAGITCTGAEEFRYQPNLGIISGKYSFYFNYQWVAGQSKTPFFTVTELDGKKLPKH
ncbi:hypothetical protein [Hymenobacter sp. GOD-10R]|uniref:hypothetical protein n=1 Tax=Hymenobacter sp. GOD-10R TaxID=3093922 RepID=UPI002D7A299D|nr:hypothetical protein [Hymenobacter sp. GOD-10R]WRQ27622.1 hypothetical protein SD425_21360 [Hymenobacter sp. GOD-10R]